MINVIFVCLLSCCSWFMPLKENLSCEKQDQIQEVERKTRENVYSLGGYSYCNTGDVTSFDFLVYNFGSDSTFFTETNVGATYSAWEFTNSNYVRLANGYNINFSATDLGFSTAHPILSANYELIQTYNYTNARNQYWKFNFKYDDNGTSVTAYRYFTLFYSTGTNTTYVYNEPGNSSSNSGKTLFIYDNSYKYFYESLRGQDYREGYNEGNIYGYNTGYAEGYDAGQQTGYANGLQDGLDTDSTALTIFTGIIDVGLLPVNVFIKMFNYEVFGINIAGLVSGLLTIAIVIIIIRIITGQKNGK